MDRMLRDRKFCSVNFAFKSFASNTALSEFPLKSGRWIEQSHRIVSSEGTFHIRIFYRRAIFYIFRSNKRFRASLSIEINTPFSARSYIEHVLRNYRKFIYWMIYFISKSLSNICQHEVVQHIAFM